MKHIIQAALGIAVAGPLLVLAGSNLPADAQVVGASPDLVPVPNRILQGTISVRNVGSANAGAFVVTAQCQKQGAAGGGGECADHPGLKAYANPAYPNRLVVNVPGLQKGKVFNHKLPFWSELDWDPGNYNFLIEADAGKSVAEINEGNNFGGAVLSK
jgi:hypothetical protein